MHVIVIGSGIVGAAATYHLAIADADVDVTIIDHGHDGKATLAGAGIICPWASSMDDGPFFDLYAAGAQYYEGLITGLAALGQSAVGYRRAGALVVSEDRDELDAAQARIERRANNRPEVGHVERVTSEQAHLLFPPLRADLDAIYIAGGARVDGRLIAQGMLDAASAHRVRLNKGLVEIVVDHDRVVGVKGANGVIEADAVVVAAGAWAADLLAPLGVSLDVEPQKGQIVHLDLGGVATGSWPSLLPIGPHYLVAFDDSRVVVGATHEIGSGFDTRVTAAGQVEVLNAALAIAPGLANARVIETRVGLRPTARSVPTIGPVPRIDGLFVGTGLGAAGLTIGPLTGRLLSDMVLDRPALIDCRPFAVA